MTPSSGPTRSPLLAFVVDDEPDIRHLIGIVLKGFGWTVEAFPGGTECLERAAFAPFPDVIILDVMMPHLNGWDTCRQLRARSELKSTYIAFLTAKTRKEDYDQGLLCGGDLYVEKGTDIIGNLNLLRERLAVRGIGRGPS